MIRHVNICVESAEKPHKDSKHLSNPHPKSIPSPKLTYPPKIGIPKRKFIFQLLIFRGNVSFSEGNFTKSKIQSIALNAKKKSESPFQLMFSFILTLEEFIPPYQRGYGIPYCPALHIASTPLMGLLIYTRLAN